MSSSEWCTAAPERGGECRRVSLFNHSHHISSLHSLARRSRSSGIPTACFSRITANAPIAHFSSSLTPKIWARIIAWKVRCVGGLVCRETERRKCCQVSSSALQLAKNVCRRQPGKSREGRVNVIAVWYATPAEIEVAADNQGVRFNSCQALQQYKQAVLTGKTEFG